MTSPRLFAISLLLAAASVAAPSAQSQTVCASDTVIFLGDSNTWYGGEDCSDPRAWSHWIVDSLRPASFRSYARSGATWSNTPATRLNTVENTDLIGNDNTIYNQVMRLLDARKSGAQAEPSVIFISAGANDAWFGKLRPKALTDSGGKAPAAVAADSPQKALTIASAIQLSCSMLQEAFPKARLILLTPFHMRSVKRDNITRTGEIIQTCGNRIGAQVIRQDLGSGIDGHSDNGNHTSDGNHTSAAGAKKLAAFIISQLDQR